MNIVEVWNNIEKFFTTISSFISRFFDLIKTFIEIIPEPFRTILLIFLPVLIIVTIYVILRKWSYYDRNFKSVYIANSKYI